MFFSKKKKDKVPYERPAAFEERVNVSTYLKNLPKNIDGIVFLLICVASLLFIADVLLGTNIVPLRDQTKPPEAIFSLVASPFIVFLTMIFLRQMPYSGRTYISYIRALICVIVFFRMNF